MTGYVNEPVITADEALQSLIDGNERFLRGEARSYNIQKEVLADLTRGQRPYATIPGCSDSRVPPELIFDAGLGELFVVRVAGNVISPEIAGSLQYAGAHLTSAGQFANPGITQRSGPFNRGAGETRRRHI